MSFGLSIPLAQPALLLVVDFVVCFLVLLLPALHLFSSSLRPPITAPSMLHTTRCRSCFSITFTLACLHQKPLLGYVRIYHLMLCFSATTPLLLRTRDSQISGPRGVLASKPSQLWRVYYSICTTMLSSCNTTTVVTIPKCGKRVHRPTQHR